MVVGVALGLNFMVAGSVGTLVPLLLRKVGADPAIASGVFVSAITDMVGFLRSWDRPPCFCRRLPQRSDVAAAHALYTNRIVAMLPKYLRTGSFGRQVCFLLATPLEAMGA